MKCYKCEAQTEVLDTRSPERRRRCANGHIFWTRELVIYLRETPQHATRKKRFPAQSRSAV